MKRKSKLFSAILGVTLLIVVLALSVSADTVSRGPNYDESHVDSGCCTVGSSGPNHYTEGYDDGYQDGKDSQQSKIDSMQSTIDSLKGNAGDNQDPEGGENQNPEGGGNQNPEGGENQNPEGGDNQNPEGGDNQNPEGGGNGSSGGGIGEGEESDEEADEEAYINYWKKLYLDKCESYNTMLEWCAMYKLYFDEANRRISVLGGDIIGDPVFEDYILEWQTVLTDVDKRMAIEEYLQSDEYLAGESIKQTLIISNYKGSEEYQNDMQNQYILGTEIATEEMYNTAYAEACDVAYSLGLADGYASYTSTNQYVNTLNNAQQKAYEKGYNEGLGSNGNSSSSTSYEFDITTILSLTIGVGALVFVLLGIAVITKKKKHKR